MLSNAAYMIINSPFLFFFFGWELCEISFIKFVEHKPQAELQTAGIILGDFACFAFQLSIKK